MSGEYTEMETVSIEPSSSHTWNRWSTMPGLCRGQWWLSLLSHLNLHWNTSRFAHLTFRFQERIIQTCTEFFSAGFEDSSFMHHLNTVHILAAAWHSGKTKMNWYLMCWRWLTLWSNARTSRRTGLSSSSTSSWSPTAWCSTSGCSPPRISKTTLTFSAILWRRPICTSTVVKSVPAYPRAWNQNILTLNSF